MPEQVNFFWVILYENHRALFEKAMEYEKDGYTWQQGVTLAELADPERRDQIKREHYLRTAKASNTAPSGLLTDILGDAEDEGCAACFL